MATGIDIGLSSLGGLLKKLFTAGLVGPGLDGLKIDAAVLEVIEQSVHAMEDTYRPLFTEDANLVNDLFWNEPPVLEEINRALSDPKLGREPDYEVLWRAYSLPHRQFSHLDETGLLAHDPFVMALEELWDGLKAAVVSHPLLSRFYDWKLLHELGREDVTQAEARRYIRKYCALRAAQCEEKIRQRYAPAGELLEGLSAQEIERGFCSYLQTPMHWMDNRKKGATEEEKEVEGESYLGEEFVIFVGRGGVGKTRFFEELERKQAEALKDAANPPYLPIYFEARMLPGITKPEDLVGLVEIKLRETLKDDPFKQGKARGLARYLVEKEKLFVLIDAFDQAPNVQEHEIANLLVSEALPGNCKRFVSTRPYDQENLTNELANLGKPDAARSIRLLPFRKDQVETFFGPFYQDIEKIHHELENKARTGREGINLLQLPELARLVKIMAVSGEVGDVANRAELMERFVRHVIKVQSTKDKGRETSAIKEMKDRYEGMLLDLERLALGTLQAKSAKANLSSPETEWSASSAERPLPTSGSWSVPNSWGRSSTWRACRSIDFSISCCRNSSPANVCGACTKRARKRAAKCLRP